MSHPIPTHDYGEITNESVCEKCGHNKYLELDQNGHIICTPCIEEEMTDEEWLEEQV